MVVGLPRPVCGRHFLWCPGGSAAAGLRLCTLNSPTHMQPPPLRRSREFSQLLPHPLTSQPCPTCSPNRASLQRTDEFSQLASITSIHFPRVPPTARGCSAPTSSPRPGASTCCASGASRRSPTRACAPLATSWAVRGCAFSLCCRHVQALLRRLAMLHSLAKLLSQLQLVFGSQTARQFMPVLRPPGVHPCCLQALAASRRIWSWRSSGAWRSRRAAGWAAPTAEAAGSTAAWRCESYLRNSGVMRGRAEQPGDRRGVVVARLAWAGSMLATAWRCEWRCRAGRGRVEQARPHASCLPRRQALFAHCRPFSCRAPNPRPTSQRAGRSRSRPVLLDATGPLAAAPIEFFAGAPPPGPLPAMPSFPDAAALGAG